MERRRFSHRLGFLAGCSFAVSPAAASSCGLLAWGSGDAPSALVTACWPCLDLIEWLLAALGNAAASIVLVPQREPLLTSLAIPAAFLARSLLRGLPSGVPAPDGGSVCAVQLLRASSSLAPACMQRAIHDLSSNTPTVPCNCKQGQWATRACGPVRVTFELLLLWAGNWSKARRLSSCSCGPWLDSRQAIAVLSACVAARRKSRESKCIRNAALRNAIQSTHYLTLQRVEQPLVNRSAAECSTTCGFC